MTDQNWTEKLNYYGIPERMHGGIVRYVEHGITPGNFLLSVFSDSLVEAAAFADEENAKLQYLLRQGNVRGVRQGDGHPA